jgi:hypothetical protein
MRNELYEQVRQMTQRSAEGVVDRLGAGVCCDLGRQTPQQRPPNVLARWRSTEKKSLSWPITPSMIWRLPEAQRRSAFDHALGELFFGRPQPALRKPPSKGAPTRPL